MQQKPSIVSALVEDRPDLLSQAVALLRRRNFDARSVTVGKTDEPHVARLTVTLKDGETSEAARLAREMGRLLYVLSVQNLTGEPSVHRELALIKVRSGADQRAQVAQLCEVFRARIVDVAQDTVIVETTGDGEKIAGFLEVLRPFGIVEMARTGTVALGRADRALDTADAPDSTWVERQKAMEARHAC